MGRILLPKIRKIGAEPNIMCLCEYQEGYKTVNCTSSAQFSCDWIEPGWYGMIVKEACLCRAHAEEFCRKNGISMSET